MIRGTLAHGPWVAVASMVLAACAVGPNYTRPGVAAPAAFQGVRAQRPGGDGDGTLPSGWWRIFGDARLDSLEARIDVSSETLKAAVAAFRQARALAQYDRAGYLPIVTAGFSATRERLSRNRPQNLGAAGPYDDFVVPLDMSYELDVWGRVRRTVEGGRASAEASAADVATVRLSLQAELAMDWFQLRTVDAQERLLERTVKSYEAALELTQVRYEGGVAPEVDLAQARTQLESTRSSEIDLQEQRAQLEHAIATLVGVSAPTFDLPRTPLEATPPQIPVGLPSALLERRPDLVGAERRVAAASAQIGVARSAYLPSIALTGTGGFESAALRTLISPASVLWTLGASLSETLFDGGRRKALSEEAVAAYDGAVATYRQAALTAFEEVEDDLSALRVLSDEAETQSAAVAAAERSLVLSQTRYEGGVTTYLEVLTAQSAALANERAAVAVQGRRFVASVLLAKALGGGWSGSLAMPPPPPGS
ncbi:RND transporter [Anaeromyxobacter oryzae]|uniref:RND transporter n=2 Tax=Anaeromyxobacter oryzae TaxID=2918170 RepID=A0ABM7X1G2_9BACT|nr:RND transporter [Anaeromyxobacter oryzae]